METGTGEVYARAMGGLWTGLAQPLARIDDAAAEPERLGDDDAIDSLRRLQYALHLAGEQIYGLEPPTAAKTAHAELADALACARDATAEVAEAVSAWGADGASAPAARVAWRIVPRPARPPAADPCRAARANLASTPAAEGLLRPLAGFVLALVGALVFVAGATLGLWPLWVGGMLARVRLGARLPARRPYPARAAERLLLVNVEARYPRADPRRRRSGIRARAATAAPDEAVPPAGLAGVPALARPARASEAAQAAAQH